MPCVGVSFPRGPSVCCGVRLQVHRDVGVSAAQRGRAVRGSGSTDPPPSRRRRGRAAPALRLQTQREPHPEGPALPRPPGGAQQPADGGQSAVQELPRPGRPLKARVSHERRPDAALGPVGVPRWLWYRGRWLLPRESQRPVREKQPGAKRVGGQMPLDPSRLSIWCQMLMKVRGQ